MAKIKKLPETVANQISAGEVVERPASVVKELVENAIDAESNKILIEVLDGGKEKVRVKDNGNGIEEEDLELAFSRYATSKIKSVNDLYSIKTLGFRGEALASIASVSRVKIISRTRDSVKGNFLKMEGGQVVEFKPVGAPIGTDITVLDLFYNTPARFKYMKTVNTEFSHITNIINREALAYPGIIFNLKHNGNEVFNTPGTGKLIDTIYSIFNQELADKLIPINYEDRFIKLDGYIVSPDYSRSSRAFEYFFVNKRTVYNQFLSKGVEEGYKGLLPTGKYPVVFISLKLNQILVDVNVHPTKREIKFSRNEIIKDVVKKGVRQALDGNDLAPKFKLKGKKQMEDNKPKEKRVVQDKLIFTEGKNSAEINETAVNEEVSIHNKEIELFKEKSPIYNKNIEYKKQFIVKDNNRVKENAVQGQKDLIGEESVGPIKKILGQIKATYIVAEGVDGLYLIDQHNGHERVNYEKIYNQYNEKEIKSQSMIIPVTIDLTLPEIEVLNRYLDDLVKLGLKIESFGGNSYLIQEIPVFLKNRPIKELLREIIDTLLEEGKTKSKAEIIDNTIACISCRSAIKAGSKMEINEMEKLISELFKTQNPYRCPHGRPILIHLTDQEINKGLGRP